MPSGLVCICIFFTCGTRLDQTIMAIQKQWLINISRSICGFLMSAIAVDMVQYSKEKLEGFQRIF